MSVSGILLAAGRSLRFGGETKQLLDFAGEPVIRRVAREACRSLLGEVVVVVGHRAGAVEAALAGLDLRSVRNSRYREAIVASVTTIAGTVQMSVSLQQFEFALTDFVSSRGTEVLINLRCTRHRNGNGIHIGIG